MRHLIPSLVALVVACGGRDAGDARRASSQVRDSAGIEIVESARPLWSDGDTWRLSAGPSVVIHASGGSDDNLPLDPASVDLDSRGRILVGDGHRAAGWNAVLVYDSLGRFLFRAGREGEGPGEFRQVWWASAYRGDSIAAFDMAGRKLVVFGPDGTLAREVRLPVFAAPPPPPGTFAVVDGMEAAYGDGYLLAYPRGAMDVGDGPGPAWSRHLLIRMTPDGEAWDTLGSFRIFQRYWDGQRAQTLWFAPSVVVAVGQSEVYVGRAETFELRRYDVAGRLTRIVRRAWEPRPVTQELQDALEEWYVDRLRSSPEGGDVAIARFRQTFASDRIAETLPAYSGALLDDGGNLWVEGFRWPVPMEPSPLPDSTRWSVFDSTGVWGGVVSMPPGFILEAVARGRALGFMVDELDVKEVYAFDLVKPTG